jgi:hypothetical protein
MRALLFALALAFAPPVLAGGLDRIEAPPAGWRGPVFEPRFDYPASPAGDVYAWQAISFRKEPERYLRALLAYALSGQDRAHWRLQANTLRRWYHVPWLGPGANGREFIHGLTRARDLAPGELGPQQIACRQNWALAFYNDVGGVVLSTIWGRGDRDPDLRALPFPAGTVAVKLVFTEARVDDDPRLAGAPEIEANIHVDPTPGDTACAPAIDSRGKPAARSPKRLRLIQVDVATREDRASYKTGWVFGSFIYNGNRAGGGFIHNSHRSDPWAKLEPMGLMWGNDPQLSDAEAADGAKPRQSIVFDVAAGFGRGGRMNGVVDERTSACSSCHMAAQWPTVAPMTAPADWARGRCWFRNLDARYPFGFVDGRCSDTAALRKTKALDFSLQLGVALRNWSLERVKNAKAVRTAVGVLKRGRGETLKVNGLATVPLRR